MPPNRIQRAKGRAWPPDAPCAAGAFTHLPIPVFLVITILLLPVASAAQTIEFSRIRPGYRETGTFKRISEYFTGEENTGKRKVFRTQDNNRDGFYFSFRVEVERGEKVPAGTVALLVYTPGTYEPTEYAFDLETQTRRWIEVIIGLTGTDWTDPEARPVAWRLEYRDATGQPIGFEESFLWRLPEENEGP